MTSIVSSEPGRVNAGIAPRKLARLAAHLTADERNDDPLFLALRLGLDQLFRRDTPERRRHLLLAADALAVLRARYSLAEDDDALVDLVEAACFARAGEIVRAKALLDARRERLSRRDMRAAFEAIERELDAQDDHDEVRDDRDFIARPTCSPDVLPDVLA